MEAPNLAMLARLDLLTLAIGAPNFGDRLIAALRAVSDADHVMAFAFSPERSPRVVASEGTIEPALADECANAYAASLYLLDPNYATIRRTQEALASIDYRKTCGQDHFETEFVRRTGASDLVGLVQSQGDVIYYLLAIKHDSRTFSSGDRWLMAQIGEILVANVHKHFSYMHALMGQNEFVMDRVLAEAPVFADLTPRERIVCLGILTGFTSESIGINLSISVNSVLTYRKRLYEKLQISSQNELFMKMIGAMIDLSRDDQPVSDRKVQARQLSAKTARARERFDDYYMAEAFICEDVF